MEDVAWSEPKGEMAVLERVREVQPWIRPMPDPLSVRMNVGSFGMACEVAIRSRRFVMFAMDFWSVWRNVAVADCVIVVAAFVGGFPPMFLSNSGKCNCYRQCNGKRAKRLHADATARSGQM